MTDPLGQSQVLPYLAGLSKLGYRFTILSFEKKERMITQEPIIRQLVADAGLEWVPMSFTSRPPLLSKFYDAVRMKRKAFALHRQKHFDMVHCRSYIAADIGVSMKRKFGVRFFFDMRGFWADEKRDGGAWKDDHPVFGRVYRYYKKKEAQYLREADHIISLTHAGKNELQTWAGYNPTVPVSVIPCCADMEHFTLATQAEKHSGRRLLGIGEDRLVISYLGSIGAWYMLDEMLDLFRHIKDAYPNACFLFVTHSKPSLIRARATAKNIKPDDLHITEASRKEVPLYIKASDINLSFIKPVYSKISSSPTKLGEVLSMGIPVIVNAGVGDVETVVNNADAGIVIREFNENGYRQAVAQIDQLVMKEPARIRSAVADTFSLDKGIEKYRDAYQQAFSANTSSKTNSPKTTT